MSTTTEQTCGLGEQCHPFNGQDRPGMCALIDPVPVSQDEKVCTHLSMFDQSEDIVKGCTQIRDQRICLNNTYDVSPCQWNSFAVEPSTVPGTCTHKHEFSKALKATGGCQIIEDLVACEAREECIFNYPPVKPVITPQTCTHLFPFNTMRSIVRTCQTTEKHDDCNKDKHCIWNECADSFGGDLFPCENQDKPYCIQKNGGQNAGTCSTDESKIIKCVPNFEKDEADQDIIEACLVQNNEDECADDEKCKWEGEKTQCHDTAGWTAGRNGLTCSIFAQRYCADGEIRREFFKFAGSQVNNPADNCCECGKKIDTPENRPVTVIDPTIVYDSCIAREDDQDNWRVVEYCESIGSDFDECNSNNGDYCEQRCGEGNERVKITPKGPLESVLPLKSGAQIELNLRGILKEITDVTKVDCGIGSINLYEDDKGQVPLFSPAFKLNQATQILNVQIGQLGSVKGFASVSTLGKVESNLVPFGFAVCESPLISVKKIGIQNLVQDVYELNEGDGEVVILNQSILQNVVQTKCDLCKPDINIIAQGAIGTIPSGLTFDEDYNLIVDTNQGYNFEGQIVISYSKDCAKLQNIIEIPIAYTVCGGETLKVKDTSATRFEFSVGENQLDVKLIESQLTSFFDNSNPNCGIKAFKLTSDEQGTPISATVSSQIIFDDTTGKVEIKNNYNKARDYKFFIQAESSGGAYAYKKMELVVQDNKAPYFKGVKGLRLPTVKITYDPSENGDTTQKFEIPQAIDDERDKIEFTWTNVEQKWIQKVSVNNNKYTVIIDKTQIKESDAGSINIGVSLKDDKYKITRLQNNYLMSVQITYVKPKVVQSTTTDVAASTAANSTATTTTTDGTASTAATGGNDTASTGNANANTDSTSAVSTTTDSASAAAADNSTADTTDSTGNAASGDATSADSTAATASTDGTKAATELAKPKEREIKSGGQLAGLAIKPDSAGADQPAVKKPEPIVIPPEDKPVKEQVLQSLQDTAGPVKETVAALPNPESTAAPAKQVTNAFKNLGASLQKRKPKKTTTTNQNNQGGATGNAATTDQPIEAAPAEPTIEMSVKTGDMDASGGLPIKSNQPTIPLGITSTTDPKTGRRRMYVQNFVDHPVSGKRQLIGVSELDVSRDVVDLTFITETDQETNPIGYYLSMTKWDENGIGIQINYTDPLMVGKGKDQVMTSLKNPDLFVSAASGEALPKDKATSVKFSPTQVPKDVSEEKLKSDSQQTNNAMVALIILQIVAQIALKGGMDDLWSMFFTLQIVCYLKFYGVIVPTNVHFYRDQFVNLVEFNSLNPQKLVQTWDPNFDLMNWIRGKQIMVVNKAQEASVFNDLKIFVLLGAILIAFTALLFIAFVITRHLSPKTADKIKDQLKSLKQQCTWNLTIRFIDISFLQTVITCGSQFAIWHSGSIYGDVTDQKWAFGLGITAGIIPVLFTKILYSNGDKLQNKETRDKFQNMYLDIHMQRNPSTKYYLPISMLRRIVFVVIPTVFYAYPFMQLQVFLVMNTCYLVWYGASRPHIDRKRIIIELFNEFMIMIFCYHLMIYTDFVTVNSMQFLMGYSNIIFFIIIAFVNIGLMIVKSVEKAKRKRRLDKLRVSHNKQMEAAYSAMDEDRKYRIKNKDRRMLIRSKLDLRSMFNAKNSNPMAQSVKDKIEAQQMSNEKANLEKKIQSKKDLQTKLSSIPESEIEQISDLKKRLETVVEEADEERFQQIEVKLRDIKKRQDKNKVSVEEKTQLEDIGELEMQDMKISYLVNSESKKLFKIADQTNADECVSSSDDEVQEKTQSASQPDVPEDLRQWIANPQKFQNYMDKNEEKEDVVVPTKLDL